MVDSQPDKRKTSSDEQTRRDALERNLCGRLLACNLDELRVLDELLARVETGRHRYGHLDLAKARNWKREWVEEILDAAIYRAIETVTEREP